MKFLMIFYDVAIPEMGLDNLIYQCPAEIKTGVRVFVEVKKNLHAGFILGKSKNNLTGFKIKDIAAVIDENPIIPPDLWDMAAYAGRVCLCGTSMALKAVLPRPLIMGNKIDGIVKNFVFNPKNFHEINFFNPFDSERFDFYLSELKINEKTLILFSRKETAEKFFASLPDELKSRALLWSSSGKNYFASWLETLAGKFDLIIGTAGAVFAPLTPEKIIIEDEASTNYIIPPVLNISAMSLAGRRAIFTGAKLITGGLMPSLKTFMRKKPEEKFFPKRENIIFADIYHKKTFHEKSKGIEGSIPLTFSLIKNTYRELLNKNTVIWILDRLGTSSEVFCSRCGMTVKCPNPKCGNSMMSMGGGNLLKCRFCGTVMELPPKCGHCGFEILSGKRPGLEALAEIAGKYYDKVFLYADKYSGAKLKKNSLILSTRRGLELCGRFRPSLIAWLDLDLELSFPGHETELEVFNLLYESYWRGCEKKVLIQSRSSGMKTANFLSQGWEKFLTGELARRKEFNLPPFGCSIELEPKNKELREKILDSFFDAGIFVMDSGDETRPLHINTVSLDPVRKVLNAVKFSKKDLKITLKN